MSKQVTNNPLKRKTTSTEGPAPKRLRLEEDEEPMDFTSSQASAAVNVETTEQYPTELIVTRANQTFSMTTMEFGLTVINEVKFTFSWQM